MYQVRMHTYEYFVLSMECDVAYMGAWSLTTGKTVVVRLVAASGRRWNIVT